MRFRTVGAVPHQKLRLVVEAAAAGEEVEAAALDRWGEGLVVEHGRQPPVEDIPASQTLEVRRRNRILRLDPFRNVGILPRVVFQPAERVCDGDAENASPRYRSDVFPGRSSAGSPLPQPWRRTLSSAVAAAPERYIAIESGPCRSAIFRRDGRMDMRPGSRPFRPVMVLVPFSFRTHRPTLTRTGRRCQATASQIGSVAAVRIAATMRAVASSELTCIPSLMTAALISSSTRRMAAVMAAAQSLTSKSSALRAARSATTPAKLHLRGVARHEPGRAQGRFAIQDRKDPDGGDAVPDKGIVKSEGRHGPGQEVVDAFGLRPSPKQPRQSAVH